MSLVSRSIVAVTASFVLVGLAACGGGATGGTASPPSQAPAGLASLDPCKIPTAQQLSADGLPAQGAPNNDLHQEPGCDFQAGTLVVTFSKNQTQTVETYQQQGQWDSYMKTTVDGRPAAQAQSAGTKGTSACTILMDSGGGVVLVDITDIGKSNAQACAEDMKYAQQVEPNLPK